VARKNDLRPFFDALVQKNEIFLYRSVVAHYVGYTVVISIISSFSMQHYCVYIAPCEANSIQKDQLCAVALALCNPVSKGQIIGDIL